ncbi:hypothetical protein F5972_29050 [Microbispora cellulosiformans]|uniref:DivIVA domain-containing protein n=1 Tax=Microbispora cellulosiformans TaxID=2614688 RepID=A0A5J5JW33_9ACTN|nr:hypothetical protein [Microbispora cellulosiformans]KAA9375014.1 hypothetical protein F5972_29050 [Microbispora cellulosiformans]
MLVVLVIAGLAVIACVVMVSLGHGGEMAEFSSDAPPLGLPAAGELTPTDLMTLRLPISLVGYGTHAVDETLNRVSIALAERDTRIAVLEQRVAELAYGQPRARDAAPEVADDKTGDETGDMADEKPRDRPEVPVAAARESAARESGDGDRSDAEETW